MFTIRDVGTRTISFSDFVAATCSPWDLCHDDRNGPIYTSPILREEHSALYRVLLQIALLGTIAAIATGS